METYELSEQDTGSKAPYNIDQLLIVADSYVNKCFTFPHTIMDELKGEFVHAALKAEKNAGHKEGIRSYQHQAGRWAAGAAARWWTCRANHEITNSDEEYEADADEDDGILGIIIEKESDQRVQAALDSLPERTRQIVELHVLDNWTFDKISEELDLSVSWVHCIYKEALLLLQQTLEDLEDFIE